MNIDQPSTIKEVLIANVPRELVLSIEEHLESAATRAFQLTHEMQDGHRTNALGQMRSFCMNEGFAASLASVGIVPSPVRGNSLVYGQTGVVRVGRFNINNQSPWRNARRSRMRREMVAINGPIESLVTPGLFDEPAPIVEVCAFFVAIFSGSIKLHPERPVDIQIAVPDRNMQNWIFGESLDTFIQGYSTPVAQPDEAMPKLKAVARTRIVGAA